MVGVEELLDTLLTFLVQRVGAGPVGAIRSTESAAAEVKDVHQVFHHPTTGNKRNELRCRAQCQSLQERVEKKNQKQRGLLAFKETNQNTQEVK